jgi:tetratricopeptide (TPR) repeat protein
MRQYWLAQVLFYGLFEYFGGWGIVLLRSALMTLTVFLVYLGLRRASVPLLFSLACVVPVFFTFSQQFTADRPVLFSFLFGVIVFLLIEEYHRRKGKLLLLLPAAMLVWSNLHGGFVFGLVMIGTFLLVESGIYLLKRSAFSLKEFRFYVLCMLGAVAASFCNPNGFLVFYMFMPHYDYFYAGIQEYQPLLTYLTKKSHPIDKNVIAILGIISLSVMRIHKMRISQMILLIGVTVMGFQSMRYFSFTATVGILMSAPEVFRLWESFALKHFGGVKPKIEKFAAMILAVIALVVFGLNYQQFVKAIPHLSKAPITPPSSHVDKFIRQNAIPGRMFNSDFLGGYLIWKLSPWKKVFVDTRQIDMASHVEFNTVMTAVPSTGGRRPVWERLLSTYDVNILAFHMMSLEGKVWGLTKDLVDNPRWKPVFNDGISLVFVRNTEGNRGLIEKYGISREDLLWCLIRYASNAALVDTKNKNYYLAIGFSFEKMNKPEEAEKAYQHVLRLDPQDADAQTALAQIRTVRGQGSFAQ